MARKTLLTESELRRFMKLADMRPVGDERIQEMGSYHTPGLRDEEDELRHSEEEGEAEGRELSDMDDEADREGAEIDDLEGDLAMADDELAAEPMDVPAVDGDVEAKFAEFMTQVAAVAQEVLGIEVDVEEAPSADDELGGEEVVDAEVDMEVDEPAGVPEEGGELDMGLEVEEEPALQEYNSEDDMVAEVARRVAARLQKESRQAEVVDQLAERIMKRLTK